MAATRVRSPDDYASPASRASAASQRAQWAATRGSTVDRVGTHSLAWRSYWVGAGVWFAAIATAWVAS